MFEVTIYFPGSTTPLEVIAWLTDRLLVADHYCMENGLIVVGAHLFRGL